MEYIGDLLMPDCIFCGATEGNEYWDKYYHHINCPWHKIRGKTKRIQMFPKILSHLAARYGNRNDEQGYKKFLEAHRPFTMADLQSLREWSENLKGSYWGTVPDGEILELIEKIDAILPPIRLTPCKICGSEAKFSYAGMAQNTVRIICSGDDLCASTGPLLLCNKRKLVKNWNKLMEK